MKTIFWHQLEALELDYSEDKYHGIIRMELMDDEKIHCDIILEDSKNPQREDLIIGTIISDKDAVEGCRFHAINLLLNEKFCKACWNSYMKEDDRQQTPDS